MSRIQQYELQFQREIALDQVETILSESPDILRERIDWIRSTVEEEWRRSIVGRYQIAVVIKEIYDDVTDNNGSVYGAKAVEAIKKALGCEDSFIYDALNVANAFTPEQIEDMARLRTPSGRPLSMSHVVALARVGDEKRRQKLLDCSVKETWTARKLRNAVDQSATSEVGKKEDGRGRPLAKPRDFDGVLDQQVHFAQDFLNRDEHVWSQPEHSLSAKVEDMDTADFTAERAERLKKHAEQMNLLAQKAKGRAEETARVHAIFVRVLKARTARHKKLGSPVRPKEE